MIRKCISLFILLKELIDYIEYINTKKIISKKRFYKKDNNFTDIVLDSLAVMPREKLLEIVKCGCLYDYNSLSKFDVKKTISSILDLEYDQDETIKSRIDKIANNYSNLKEGGSETNLVMKHYDLNLLSIYQPFILRLPLIIFFKFQYQLIKLNGYKIKNLKYGLRLWVKLDPKKPKAIFIHGLGMGLNYYSKLLRQLSSKYSVYAFDIPFFRFDNGNNKNTFISPDTLSDLIYQNIPEGNIFLFSNSFGTVISINLDSKFKIFKRCSEINFIDPVFFLEQIADTGLRFFLIDYLKFSKIVKSKLNIKQLILHWMITLSLKHQIVTKRLYGTINLTDWNINWNEAGLIKLYIGGKDFLMRQLDLEKVKERLGKNKTVIHYQKQFYHGDFVNNFKKYI